MNPQDILKAALFVLQAVPGAIQAIDAIKADLGETDLAKVQAAMAAAQEAGKAADAALQTIPDDPA